MQAKRRTGINPLAYLGVDPITPPMLVVEQRDPTDNDFSEYELGAIWMVSIPTKIWMMVNKDPSVSPKWVQIYPGDGSGTNFFTTDDGNTAIQVGGILNIFGSNDVATYSTPGSNTVTVALENDVTIVSSLTLTPILSSVLTTDAVGLVVGAQGTDLQMFLGNTGATPSFYTPVSEDGSVTITAGSVPGTINFQAVGGGGGGFGGLDADTGTAVPLLNKISTLGDATNIDTSASGHTVTFTLRSILTLPQTNSAGSQGIIKLGANRFITNLGTDNTFVGDSSGNFTLTTGSATGNTGVGTGVLNDLTTSANNSALGVGALSALVDGLGANSVLGAMAGGGLVDGDNNVLLGINAGLSYTFESDNISISNEGVAFDSGVIRIGNTTDHDHCYIGGIYGASGGATNGVVSADTDGKLFTSNGTNGQVLIGGGTGPVWATITSSDASIIFTPGANQLDMVAVGGGGSSGIVKLGADVGTPALPLLGEVDIIGGTNINTITAPNAVAVNLDDWISLPATNAAATAGGLSLDSTRFLHGYSSANDSVFLGYNSGNLGCEYSKCVNNIGIGTSSLSGMVQAANCIAIGFEALKNYKGTTNRSYPAEGRNIAIGTQALLLATASAGGASSSQDNIAIGYFAGKNITASGDSNVLLGSSAGSTITDGSHNIMIGGSTQPSSATANYECKIGGTSHSYYLPGLSGSGSGTTRFVTANETTGKLGIISNPTLSTGDILGIDVTTNDPVWKNIVSSDSSITVSNYLGDVNITLSGSKLAFHAYQVGNTVGVTGNGALYNLGSKAIFAELYDYGNNLYPGDGSSLKAYYTATKTGLYMFIVTVLAGNLPVGATSRVDPINIVITNAGGSGTAHTYSLINPVVNYNTASGTQTIQFSQVAYMVATSQAYFQFGLTTSPVVTTITVNGTGTTISGFFIA